MIEEASVIGSARCNSINFSLDIKGDLFRDYLRIVRAYTT